MKPLRIILFMIAGVLLIQQPVLAQEAYMSQEEQEKTSSYLTSQDIMFWTHLQEICEDPSSAISLRGGENLEKIFNFFIDKGLSPVQAAGIVGNIVQESGGDPLLIQGGGQTENPLEAGGAGWGIIQWTPAGKVLGLATEAGLDSSKIHTLETQLELVWWHMNNTSPSGTQNFINVYKNATDVKQAALLFERGMEKSADVNYSWEETMGIGPDSNLIIDAGNSKGMSNRYAAAEQAMSYAGSAAGGSAGSGVNPDTGCYCSTSGAGGDQVYNLGDQTHPFAVGVANTVGNMFGVKTIGGWREPDGFNEHSSGKALDIMVNDDGRAGDMAAMAQFGDPIFDYLKQNASELKIQSIIWKQTYYAFDQSGNVTSSRFMEDRGSPTQNHYDHIHVFMDYIDSETGGTVPTDRLSSNIECSYAAVLGNSVSTAVNFAWEDSNRDPSTPKPSYKEAHDRNTSIQAGGYTDCSSYVANVMRESGLDPDYPSVTTNQINYLNSNTDKYVKVNISDTSALQPGDILINEGHTALWVGSQPGFSGNAADASLGDHVPWAVTYDASGYSVYRFGGSGGSSRVGGGLY